METRVIDGSTFRHILRGGAKGIRTHMQTINELNVFPVPDGDTGINMSRTIESGIAKISAEDNLPLGHVAADFAKGSLFGARGNSGVILSQFFAGVCGALLNKETATAYELADAYIEGVKRAYAAVANPVEGTILTVFRESAEYAKAHMEDDSSLEAFLALTIEEAERSLRRTKDILPVLAEADVVDSGGAGYLCIAKGMYDSLREDDDTPASEEILSPESTVNYDLFTSETQLTYGYCTECLVRLQKAKVDPAAFDETCLVRELEALRCDSIVALKEGDVLKLHAHTMIPGDILTLCQRYGEFLNIKIENMCLQHSEKVAAEASAPKKKPHKTYGVVTVATGDGMTALFESLGADVVINGGQTGNPSAAQFLEAFEALNADHILVFPNNSNILLTARQAADLWEAHNVTVIPTKTLPQGYAALSVFNPSVTALEDQVSDLTSAKDAVVSGEITTAIRDTLIGGVDVHTGEYIGILDGELVTAQSTPEETLCRMIRKIPDLSRRELITLFVGGNVTDEQRVLVTELLEETFEDLAVEVYLGGQEIYDYLIAVE
ncbi:MAG: DAK2 domain-containing protein [Ruminococcaceae bacterium]|nr:DAK2 domain-containing protein [Oscillospiraceae bacterium]